MKAVSPVVVAIVLAQVVALPAQCAEPGRPSAAKSPAAGRVAPLLQLLRLPRIEGLPPPTSSPACSSDATVDDCSAKILLHRSNVTYTVDGTTYTKALCTAVGYDVNVRVGTSGVKRINYTLEIKDASIVTPKFVGVIIDQDLPPADFDGQSIPAPDKLILTTKRQTVGHEILFLPEIKWNNGGQWELCAAVDPKIVNVP